MERWVVPGTGGGTGTQTNPFRGLQAAADSLVEGTAVFFHVAAGTYDAFIVSTSGKNSKFPHVFQGPKSGSAVVDGGNTDRHVVQVGEFDVTTSFIVLDRLTIQNGKVMLLNLHFGCCFQVKRFSGCWGALFLLSRSLSGYSSMLTG